MDKLTARQSSFVDYYCDPGSDTYNNAYQSALKAGYAENTAKTACQQILDKHSVQEAIEAKRAEVLAKLDITREECVGNARWLIEHGKANNKHQAVHAGNEQLSKIGGFFTEQRQGSEMPTINVHMPEAKPAKPDADKPPIKLHQDGA